MYPNSRIQTSEKLNLDNLGPKEKVFMALNHITETKEMEKMIKKRAVSLVHWHWLLIKE